MALVDLHSNLMGVDVSLRKTGWFLVSGLPVSMRCHLIIGRVRYHARYNTDFVVFRKVNDARIICSACRSLLGYPENHVEFDDSELFRLDKWNLSLNENETFQLECFLTSRLISYAEEGGVRRLLVSSQPQSTSPVDRFKVVSQRHSISNFY